SETAATLSVRTQQIIAHETNAASVADPLGGSYLVEALTRELELGARTLIEDVDRRGGAIEAIETGFTQDSSQESAYRCLEAGGYASLCHHRRGVRRAAQRIWRVSAGDSQLTPWRPAPPKTPPRRPPSARSTFFGSGSMTRCIGAAIPMRSSTRKGSSRRES